MRKIVPNFIPESVLFFGENNGNIKKIDCQKRRFIIFKSNISLKIIKE